MRENDRPTVLLATDVFGVTAELRALVRQLSAHVVSISPYRDAVAFAREQEGYAAFLKAGGVEAYARRAAESLRSGAPGHKKSYDVAIGFSAGATALWLCLAEAALDAHLPCRAALYYGSRIRDHASLKPRRPVQLIFAEREASFDPVPLAAQLRAQGVEAAVLPGTGHGFMNPLSPGFDPQVVADELLRLGALLQPEQHSTFGPA